MNEPTTGSVDDVMTSDESAIAQFTLRGNPEVEALVQQLRDLGVIECRPVSRVYWPTNITVFPSMPLLRCGRRYSATSIRAIEIAQAQIGRLIADEVENLVAETVGGYELLVETFVSMEAQPDSPTIVAFVTGFAAIDSADDVLTIEMR